MEPVNNVKDDLMKTLKKFEKPEAWKEAYEDGMERVQEFPLAAVSIAAGIGFFLGFAGVNKAFQNVKAAVQPHIGDIDPMGIFMNAVNGSFNTRRYGGGSNGREHKVKN